MAFFCSIARYLVKANPNAIAMLAYARTTPPRRVPQGTPGARSSARPLLTSQKRPPRPPRTLDMSSDALPTVQCDKLARSGGTMSIRPIRCLVTGVYRRWPSWIPSDHKNLLQYFTRRGGQILSGNCGIICRSLADCQIYILFASIRLSTGSPPVVRGTACYTTAHIARYAPATHRVCLVPRLGRRR